MKPKKPEKNAWLVPIAGRVFIAWVALCFLLALVLVSHVSINC